MPAKMGNLCLTPIPEGMVDTSLTVSPVLRSVFQSACGETGRVFLDSFPGGPARALDRCGLSRQRLHNDLIDLGAVEGPLRMIDRRSCEGEYDRLVLLDDRQRCLIAMFDEGRDACGGLQTTPAIAFAPSMSLAINIGEASPRKTISAGRRPSGR
jgi:hypothetical protein